VAILTMDIPEACAWSSQFVSVGISVFLVGLDSTIVSPAIPSIIDEFHSLSSMGWWASEKHHFAENHTNALFHQFGSVCFLTTAMNIVWGKAYRYFPLKAGYMSAIFLFELGSLIRGTYGLVQQSDRNQRLLLVHKNTRPRSTVW
jgi:MFS family permease